MFLSIYTCATLSVNKLDDSDDKDQTGIQGDQLLLRLNYKDN